MEYRGQVSSCRAWCAPCWVPISCLAPDVQLPCSGRSGDGRTLSWFPPLECITREFTPFALRLLVATSEQKLIVSFRCLQIAAWPGSTAGFELFCLTSYLLGST